MTDAMQIGPSYMIQFDLVMGCHTAYTRHIDNRLYLEYSVDHGSRWDLVKEPCLPPMLCDEYHAGTLYDASQFPEWTRTTVLLPQDTWSVGFHIICLVCYTCQRLGDILFFLCVTPDSVSIYVKHLKTT